MGAIELVSLSLFRREQAFASWQLGFVHFEITSRKSGNEIWRIPVRKLYLAYYDEAVRANAAVNVTAVPSAIRMKKTALNAWNALTGPQRAQYPIDLQELSVRRKTQDKVVDEAVDPIIEMRAG